MSLKFKYRRVGAFVIDLTIIKIFAQVGIDLYLFIVAFVGKGAGISLSLSDSLALPVLLSIYLMLLLVFIGVYLGYHWTCHVLLGTSLSRYCLGLRVVSDNGLPLVKSDYMKREFDKVVWCIASLGLYALYSVIKFTVFSRAPFHDVKNHSHVENVEVGVGE